MLACVNVRTFGFLEKSLLQYPHTCVFILLLFILLFMDNIKVYWYIYKTCKEHTYVYMYVWICVYLFIFTSIF